MGSRKWKNATIITVSITMALVIVVSCLAISVVQDGLKLRKAIQLGVGTTNTRPPIAQLPAPSMPESKTTLDTQFSRFASDVVVRLESNTLDPPEGMHTVQVLHTPTGQNNAWIVQDENQIWVVFRGTATKDEWEKDFQFKQVPFLTRMLNKNISKLTYPKMIEKPQVNMFPDDEDVQVHSGFMDIYSQLRDDILETLGNTSQQICITGHSLGGAMAQLALCDIANTLPEASINTVVFGCPRVGNQQFAHKINEAPQSKHFVMVTNTCDMVTDVPLAVQPTLDPVGTPLVYVHPGNTHNFTDNRGTWIQNHMMGVYVDHLENSSFT